MPGAPPTATITNPSGNVTVAAGQSVSFVGTGSDPNGLPFTGHWDFGDSVSADGLSVTHTYSAAGTYTVKFTVTNSQGLTSAPDQRIVTVTAAATATLSADPGADLHADLLGLPPAQPGAWICGPAHAFGSIVSVSSSEAAVVDAGETRRSRQQLPLQEGDRRSRHLGVPHAAGRPVPHELHSSS